MSVIKELRAEQRERLQQAMDAYLAEQRLAAKKGYPPPPMRKIAEEHGVTLNSMRNMRKVQLEMARQKEAKAEDDGSGDHAA